MKRGFTVIELLTVLTITGLLIGLLLPAVQMVREAARRASCSNNLHQISLAVLHFEDLHRRLPIGQQDYLIAEAPKSWFVEILPFMEQDPMFRQAMVDFDSRPRIASHIGLQTPVPLFVCPSFPEAAQTHLSRGFFVASTCYLGNGGMDHQRKGGVFERNTIIRFSDISDGLSNTLLIGERPPSVDYWLGWWYSGVGQDGQGSAEHFLGVRELKTPGYTYLSNCNQGPYSFGPFRKDNLCDSLHFGSMHPIGAHFASCDGSVRFFPYSDNELLPTLATRAGAEAVDP